MKSDAKGLDKDKQKPNIEVKENKHSAGESQKENKDAKNMSSENLKEKLGDKAKENESPRDTQTPEKDQVRKKSGEFSVNQGNSSNRHDGKSIFKKFQLQSSEIIENIYEMSPKKNNSNFVNGLLNKKILESKIDEEVLKAVSANLSKMASQFTDDILNNIIDIPNEKKSVSDIIQQKESSRKAKIEELIRQQKIKEIQDNKESIGNKIKSLEENMRLLEIDPNINISKVDLNTSIRGEVDDNIRKSRIKEIKQAKDLLEKKLQTLDEHVQKLMTEEELTNHKKFNLKQFLDNFEKDKSEAAVRTKKWENDQKERIKHLLDMEEKAKLKVKKKESESLGLIKQKEKEREEVYKRNLEKKKEKDRLNHEHLEKLKEEWKNRAGSGNHEYAFQRLEKEYTDKIHKENEERKNEELVKMQERKNLLKPINREELIEFSRKVNEDRQKKIFEKEKERITKFEEIQSKNEHLPKPETVTYHKAVEEAKLQKENKEKEKLDKVYKNMKVKQFSKVIKTELLPRIDEKKKKEVEDRIEKLRSQSKVEKLKRKTRGRVLLKKRDPNAPEKYKWKLKLNTSADDLSPNKKSRSKSAKSFSESLAAKSKIHPDLLDEDLVEQEIKKRISKSRSGEKRKPMEKNPDYLTEMRIKKTQMSSSNPSTAQKEKKSERKWHKMINNGKYSLIENVEQIKIKANILEEQAKMKEKFLQLNGGSEKNPELGENVSNMLIDAIKAKLTILENISKKK